MIHRRTDRNRILNGDGAVGGRNIHGSTAGRLSSRSGRSGRTGRSSGTGATVARNNLLQHATGGILDGAIIVDDVAVHGDGVTHGQIISALALQTIAQQRLVLTALDGDNHRNVLITGIIGGLDFRNLTGQGSIIRQRIANTQSKGGIHDCLRIGRSLHALTRHNVDQNTFLSKLDGAVVILQRTTNGDGITDSQILTAFTHQTIALDALVGQITDLDDNGDVVILSVIIRRLDRGDYTGQDSRTLHLLAFGQVVGCFNNQLLRATDGSRNGAIEGYSLLLSFTVGDGSGQLVINRVAHGQFSSVLTGRNIDDNPLILASYSDFFVVGRPLYGITQNLTLEFVIDGSLGGIFDMNCLEILSSLSQCFGLRCLCSGGASLPLILFRILATTDKASQAKNENEKNR